MGLSLRVSVSSSYRDRIGRPQIGAKDVLDVNRDASTVKVPDDCSLVLAGEDDVHGSLADGNPFAFMRTWPVSSNRSC
jgi:hypothetical protein